MASDLKLSFKQVRKLMAYLEREKLVSRAHVREGSREGAGVGGARDHGRSRGEEDGGVVFVGFTDARWTLRGTGCT